MKRFHSVHFLCLVSALSLLAIGPVSAEEKDESVTASSSSSTELPLAEKPSRETTELVTISSSWSIELPTAEKPSRETTEKSSRETTENQVNLPAGLVAEKSSSDLTLTDDRDLVTESLTDDRSDRPIQFGAGDNSTQSEFVELDDRSPATAPANLPTASIPKLSEIANPHTSVEQLLLERLRWSFSDESSLSAIALTNSCSFSVWLNSV